MNMIPANTELSLKFGELYWLNEAKRDSNPVIQIVANVLFDITARESADPSISECQSWTSDHCSRYLAKLNMDKEGQFYRNLHIDGYNSRQDIF